MIENEKALGPHIAEIRHQRKMTQEQLAELSDITVNYLSKVERGVVTNISARLLYKIAQALNVTMEELYLAKPIHTISDVDPQYNILLAYLNKVTSDSRDDYIKLFIEVIKLSQK